MAFIQMIDIFIFLIIELHVGILLNKFETIHLRRGKKIE